MDKKLLVIFGATGDLVAKKIFPILGDIKNIEIVTYSRRKVDSKYLSIIGNFEDLSPLVNYVNQNKFNNIYFYFALPPSLYLDLIKNIHKNLPNKLIKIALEKPFGTSHVEAKKLAKLIENYRENNFYLVDHYVAKAELIKFIDDRCLITTNIKSIQIIISETERLDKRGQFFDKVGVIKDTVQNHMLSVARVILGSEISDKNFKVIKESIVLKQFDGYKNLEGVKLDSKTETHFEGKFMHEDIMIKLHSAKAQTENKKYIKVDFVDQTSHIISLDDPIDSPKSPHQHILEDFISDNKKYAIQVKHALDHWRIIEQLQI